MSDLVEGWRRWKETGVMPDAHGPAACLADCLEGAPTRDASDDLAAKLGVRGRADKAAFHALLRDDWFRGVMLRARETPQTEKHDRERVPPSGPLGKEGFRAVRSLQKALDKAATLLQRREVFDAIARAYAESGRGADGGGKERPRVRRPRPDVRELGRDMLGVRLLADAARDFLNSRAQARETERTAAHSSRRGPRRGRPREDGLRWRVAEGMDFFRAFRGDSGTLGWNDIENWRQGSLFAFLAPYVRLVYPDAGDEAIAKLAMKTRKRARAARSSPA